ncbi:ATP-binding protein [Bacillus sp. FJAT-49736]|uniref:ATP-binding protein n=1 Tax=Bacillus sp. FJAT-49736 TaxID=2833582 RepID=UPI002015F3BC|nr:ATP-binding protein [Bacillus sp. FJAT-49736]
MFIIAFSIVGITVHYHQSSNKSVSAQKGVLDLSHYNLQKEHPFPLDGEWQFVPGKLVDHSYFAQNNRKPTYIKVPSIWSKNKIEGKNLPVYSSGTYRLVVHTKNGNSVLGIKTSNIRMSNSIYINGKLIGSSGVPKNDTSYIPQNTPYVKYFYSKDTEIELIVHVANFDYASGGGIMEPIYLGSSEGIQVMREKAVAYDLIMIAAFLIIGVYFIGFYIRLRKNKSLLYFSLFSFAVGIYSATHGEKLIYLVASGIPYAIFERLQGLSSDLLGLFLLLFFHHSLRAFSNKRTVKYIVFFGMFLMISMMFPIRINSKLELLHPFYLVIVFLYLVWIQLKAVMKRTLGGTYLMLGSITIIVYFVFNVLNLIGKLSINSLPPFLPYIYLSFLSLYMANLFAATYRKNEEMSIKLLEVDRFKDEFLEKTSHEFRTPLHAIIAILQSMISSPSSTLTKGQTEKVNLAVGSAKRLSNLVNDILDLSKLKRGELVIKKTQVNLYSVTHLLTEMFSYILNKDVILRNEIPKNVSYVYADEDRLRQILYNLVGNAIKHTDQGEIVVSAHKKNDFIHIFIRDTGIGISEQQLEAIFDLYNRGDVSTQNGFGLGLNITKQLVELQGGSIWVESEIGKGSVFTFSVPIALMEGNPNRNASESSYEIPTISVYQTSFPFITGSGKKILVADDDHTNLAVLIEALVPEGYQVIAVDNGNDVLDQLTKHPDISIVLLDIMMPKLSGYEVCKLIRRKYSLSELPILMLTAAVLPEDLVAAFQSGANDFIHKPFDLMELKARVSNLIMIKESAKAATDMEVAFLQAQIKPHFLYNVLNSILSLSYTDVNASRKMITDFAQFLRGSFDFSNTIQLVPLKKELTLVQAYVEIEKVRFTGKIQFHMDDINNIDCLVPPLFLQPIIENAIRHGVTKKVDGGKVSLRIRKVEKTVVFEIEDNGVGMSQERIHEVLTDRSTGGVGIHNISRRLKQYQHTSFSFQSEVNQGTKVVISFPYIDASEKRSHE